MTPKIEALIGRHPTPFEYGNTFGREAISGRDRLVVGFDQAQDGCLHALAGELVGPFQLLYVLHTTRTGATLGRYESPALTAHEMHNFMHTFGRFLSEDARHDLWLHSHDDDATIVLDRHNIIYAYGPIERFETVLLNIGVHTSGVPRVPDPHVHHYHSEWDDSEREILNALAWIRKPLRDVDVQYSDGRSAG